MAVELSLFDEWRDGRGKVRRELAPYLRIGSFIVSINAFGIRCHAGRRSVGYQRHIGFWSSPRVSK